MATLCRRTGKTPGYEIQFFDTSGRRITIYLGGRRYNERTANDLKRIVEELVFYRDNPSQLPKKSVLDRMSELPEGIQRKLAKAGLVEIPPDHTVKELWNTFMGQKTGIKESTMKTYETARERFFAFFKGTESLADLTPEMMRQWKNFLRTGAVRTRTSQKGFAESTTAGTIVKTRAVFNWGVSSGWIEKSPLKGVECGSFVNQENDQEIEPDDYFRLLAACPCQEWRCIIALARIGGLRAPSEVMSLRWQDIRWSKGEFTARSPKTEHHEGKDRRIVPLFPALEVELRRLFEMLPNRNQEFVITRYPNREETNLGTPFSKIVKKAGLDKIKRPFDNMRMCRSNEIDFFYDPRCEVAWIGHSVETAKKHYLRAMKADFKRALNLRAAEQDKDWAIFKTQEEYERYVESCREKPSKSKFPALEKIFPAVLPAARIGMDWIGSEVRQ